MSSSFIPILLYCFGKKDFFPWMLTIAIIFPIIDYLRRYSSVLYLIADIIFQKITRPNEISKITGASWLLIGSGITIFLFNQKVAIVSLLIMSISDSLAAILGIKYGNTILFNKSLEGTCIFFFSTTILISILTSVPILITLIIALVLTIIELFSTEIFNDNLLIPIFAGFLLTIGGMT